MKRIINKKIIRSKVVSKSDSTVIIVYRAFNLYNTYLIIEHFCFVITYSC